MKKRDGRPELETFTILNPNFIVPAEETELETKSENQLSEGNISENQPFDE
ncbi:hypothetical protein [Ornithinibacillus sp. 179-J 7C1 HS]|uniref:hypothetical protein n=1 Tax=Ornithinibacillus sp. 179-J 7C1 HS TaxID=3142384 RepID=UPI0039A07EB4